MCFQNLYIKVSVFSPVSVGKELFNVKVSGAFKGKTELSRYSLHNQEKVLQSKLPN